MGLGRLPGSQKMGLFGLRGWDGGPAIYFLKRNVKKVAAQDAPVSSKTFFKTQGPYPTLCKNDVLEVGFGHPEFNILTLRTLIF